MIVRHSVRLVAGSALILFPAGIALASSGGGGGSGFSPPSESAPQYDPVVEYRNGVAALEVKNFKAAKTAFDRVVSATPRDANAQYMAGVARVGLDDTKGARKFFEKAVKLDAKMIRAQRELAIASVKLNDMPKAESLRAELQARAQTCAGTCPDAGELTAAIDAIAAAIGGGSNAGLDPGASMMFASAEGGDQAYGAAVSLVNQGQYLAAIETLNVARLSFGSHPDILTYLGFANRKLGKFDVAEDYYRQALAVAPHHRGATEYYGELMVERKDMAGARIMLAELDRQCAYGCYEADELRQWIALGRSPHS